MSEKILVTVKEGKIRGVKQFSTFSGVEYYSFYGVPYGQPPIDNLRFKDPVKVKPWKEVLDATAEQPGCSQFSLLSYEYLGTEDCLFNNIYIPKMPKKNENLRPVIVNIHPGALHFGTPHSTHYGSPQFIMHHDTVYVCISYRLHILGFLNLGLKECSGNQALKDIILSLKWIKENIHSFGGDPDNVTLIGSSSGAGLVNILMLSPAARGLFHKAVIMGSYVLSPVVPFRDTNKDVGLDVALTLGYQDDPKDSKKILLFLRKQEPLMLIEQCRRCQKAAQETIAAILPIAAFSPTIDPVVIPDSPKNLVPSITKIPTMVGFSQKESVLGFVRTQRAQTEKNFNASFRQNAWGWGYNLSDKDVKLINKEMEMFYTNGQPLKNAPLPLKVDIQSDISMSEIYDTVINPISKDLPSSVFVYLFEFEGNIFTMNTTLKTVLDEPLKGTLHATDFSYWNRIGDPGDKDAHQMVHTFTKLITTFARNGDPNYEEFSIKWRPSTPETPCYLSINKPFAMVDGKLNNDRLEFWDTIKKKYKKE
ncbi:esterase E4-like [Planococcus citri]|uniref:esterase E4-like n=1 Tax=Planococcus citri TaxID=170843 RepID=UPI0031F99158